jgi:hypothetical protein
VTVPSGAMTGTVVVTVSGVPATGPVFTVNEDGSRLGSEHGQDTNAAKSAADKYT